MSRELRPSKLAGPVRLGLAPSRVTRWIILGVVAVVFAVPLLSLLEFSLRDGFTGNYTLIHWTGLFDPENARPYRQLFQAIGNSFLLAAVTVGIVLVILLPTMLLVHLSFPKLRRVLEFICIIPITVPAIVLVVGLAPVYSFVVKIFGSGTWTLAFAYGILVLPYAYRAIQANLDGVPVVTLSEAARSLGAGWPTVVWSVLLPNLRRGVLAAAFITVAVVLGEFTIASLLNRRNLQTAILQVSQSDPWIAAILALLALAFAFILLLIIGRLGTVGNRSTS
jgi:putative spermidine/putrescine transport system permease protein